MRKQNGEVEELVLEEPMSSVDAPRHSRFPQLVVPGLELFIHKVMLVCPMFPYFFLSFYLELGLIRRILFGRLRIRPPLRMPQVVEAEGLIRIAGLINRREVVAAAAQVAGDI